MKVNSIVKHPKFQGNGIVKKIDSSTYSITFAVVYFPLINERVCKPVSEFEKVTK